MRHLFAWNGWQFLGCALMLLLVVGCQSEPHGSNYPGVGQPLASLQLEPLTGNGQPMNLQSLQGKVTLINYWATWCGPCRVEFPKLTVLHQELLQQPNFLYLSISTGFEDRDETLSETEKFLKQNVATHPTWFDSGSQSFNQAARQFGLSGIPATLVIDQQGIVRGVWSGYRSGYEKEMRQLIDQLLANR